MHRPRVLIADDDPIVVKFVSAILRNEGCDSLTATDGATTLKAVERDSPDLVILDIMMPNVDGFEVCRRLREWSQVPIIMLSARGETQDKVHCLNLGADDFVTKPFAMDELIARVKSVIRRARMPDEIREPSSFVRGNIEIDLLRRRVTVAGKEVRLTPTEYMLLQELVSNVGKVLSHTHLLGRVWGADYVEDRQFLHVFINRLRTKIEADPQNPEYITTVSGVGYLFKDIS
ncbi:MAG: response regulator transcription factor [Dehalococcoidales bacterium]|nr:response regulator transcription factor [Dehalococcoidales bacterium]